ncbi:DUF3303 family protein [Nocardia sp. NPDC050193]
MKYVVSGTYRWNGSAGTGGFAVVETDNPIDLLDAPEKFGMIAEYQIHPVAELADVVQAFQEGAAFRESIG